MLLEISTDNNARMDFDLQVQQWCQVHELSKLLEMSDRLKQAALKHNNPLHRLLGVDGETVVRGLRLFGNAEWLADRLLPWYGKLESQSSETVPPVVDMNACRALEQLFQEGETAVVDAWYSQVSQEPAWPATLITLVEAAMQVHGDSHTCWHPTVVQFTSCESPSAELTAAAYAIREQGQDVDRVMNAAVQKLQYWSQDLQCSTEKDFKQWLTEQQGPVDLLFFYNKFCTKDDLVILGW